MQIKDKENTMLGAKILMTDYMGMAGLLSSPCQTLPLASYSLTIYSTYGCYFFRTTVLRTGSTLWSRIVSDLLQRVIGRALFDLLTLQKEAALIIKRPFSSCFHLLSLLSFAWLLLIYGWHFFDFGLALDKTLLYGIL